MIEGTVRVSEIVEFSKRYAELGRKAYRLELEETPFGFFYVGPRTYTLAWHGTINFSKLETQALEHLSSAISDGLTKLRAYKEETRDATRVSLIADNELFRYQLADPEDYSRYRTALEDPDIIAFARYDVSAPWLTARPLEYSFTADNPRLLPPDTIELAVRLPRRQPISQSLIAWAIKHHAAASATDQIPDPRFVATTLSQLI